MSTLTRPRTIDVISMLRSQLSASYYTKSMIGNGIRAH
jgi:hypothetical protein